MSLTDLLAGPARHDPDRVALVIDEVPTTYAQLEAAVATCAANLDRAGVRPGWRVALADDTSVAAVATMLGAMRLGAATALMNPRLTTDELRTLVTAAATTQVGAAGPHVTRALRQAGVQNVLGPSDLLDPLPPGGAARTATAPSAGTATSAAPASPSAPAPPPPPHSQPHPTPDQDALVLFTSGTTGTPKAVPLSHRQLEARIAAFAPPFDPTVPPTVSLMCVPLVHVGGSLGLLVSLAKANSTVVQTRFDAGEWLALVARNRVQSAFVVPTMLHRLLEHPDFEKTDLSSLVALSYGAAPAPPDLVRRAMEALPGVAFSNVFGQTETVGSITALGPDDHAAGRLGSVGRPLPGIEVRVVDPATGNPLPVGSVGELWVRDPGTARPAGGTGAAGQAQPGWQRTGDMMSIDAEGYLYPAGRMSDTINRGGEKFAPAEVEAVLRTHPAVQDVAVAGVPDPEMGQRVGAAVVLHHPTPPEELRRHCRDRLAAFKLPERIVAVDQIPYNDFGKVSRRELEALLAGPGH